MYFKNSDGGNELTFIEYHEQNTVQGTYTIALTPQNKAPEESIIFLFL